MDEVWYPGEGGGGGDLTSASNEGSGVPLFDRKSGQTLVFRSIRSLNPAITVQQQDGEVQVDIDFSQLVMDGGTY